MERFLTERCELDPLAFEPSATLADAYLAWLGPGAGSRERDLLWKNLAVKGFERQTRRFEQPATFGQIREPRRRMRGYAGLRLRAGAVAESECMTCEEGTGAPNECPKSPRSCGHHCNHSVTHDSCCSCGAQIVTDEEPELDRDAQLASLEAFRKALES